MTVEQQNLIIHVSPAAKRLNRFTKCMYLPHLISETKVEEKLNPRNLFLELHSIICSFNNVCSPRSTLILKGYKRQIGYYKKEFKFNQNSFIFILPIQDVHIFHDQSITHSPFVDTSSSILIDPNILLNTSQHFTN